MSSVGMNQLTCWVVSSRADQWDILEMLGWHTNFMEPSIKQIVVWVLNSDCRHGRFLKMDRGLKALRGGARGIHWFLRTYNVVLSIRRRRSQLDMRIDGIRRVTDDDLWHTEFESTIEVLLLRLTSAAFLEPDLWRILPLTSRTKALPAAGLRGYLTPSSAWKLTVIVG